MFAYTSTNKYPKNTAIINEGDKTDLIYLIRSGRVRVFLRSEDGKRADINVLEAGDYFGEMVLDEGLRSASVVTLEPTELSVIPQSVFRGFVRRNPDFAMQVILKLILRARGLLQNVKSLALLDVYGRVARVLLELARLEDNQLVIKEKQSAQAIAHRIGTSRESVSRTLKELVNNGYIHIDGERWLIAKDLPRHRQQAIAP